MQQAMLPACVRSATGLVFLLFLIGPIRATEIAVTDEQRAESSVVILTGKVVATRFVQEAYSGTALYSADVEIQAVEKTDMSATNNVVVYYLKQHRFLEGGPDGRTTHVRPETHALRGTLPAVRLGSSAKLWCTRRTFPGHTNVLFIPWGDGMKEK